MAKELLKIVNNEYVDASTLLNLQRLGFVSKITFTQYVITSKGLKEINN